MKNRCGLHLFWNLKMLKIAIHSCFGEDSKIILKIISLSDTVYLP